MKWEFVQTVCTFLFSSFEKRAFMWSIGHRSHWHCNVTVWWKARYCWWSDIWRDVILINFQQQGTVRQTTLYIDSTKLHVYASSAAQHNSITWRVICNHMTEMRTTSSSSIINHQASSSSSSSSTNWLWWYKVRRLQRHRTKRQKRHESCLEQKSESCKNHI